MIPPGVSRRRAFLPLKRPAGYPFANFDDRDHRVDGDDEGDDSSESFGASVQVDWDFGNEVSVYVGSRDTRTGKTLSRFPQTR